MRLLLIPLVALLIPSCESLKDVPVTVSYTGKAGGHEYTAGYNKTTGAVLVVNQK